jgi:hypothetical protein
MFKSLKRKVQVISESPEQVNETLRTIRITCWLVGLSVSVSLVGVWGTVGILALVNMAEKGIQHE